MPEAAQNEEKVEFESNELGSVEDNAQESNQEAAPENKESSDVDASIEKNENEEVEKKEVGFSDFLKARGVEVDTSKLEEKTEEKVEDKKEKKPFIPRVLDDLPEEFKPIFKNMSIESYAKVKPIFLEHQKLKQENEQLKSRKPEGAASVYGHPEAFTLTKEYKTFSRDYTLAEQIKSHWATQAAKISRGDKWQDLDMDPKTGKFTLSEPKESNAEAEVYVGDQVQMARDQFLDARNQLKGFIDGYNNSYKAEVEVLTSAIEKYFPGYSAKEHPTQQIQKAVIDALPASFRDNPVATLLAMTAANNAILMGRLKKAQEEINKLKGIKTDVEKSQPGKREFVNGKGGNGGVKFSDFANRRAQVD